MGLFGIGVYAPIASQPVTTTLRWIALSAAGNGSVAGVTDGEDGATQVGSGFATAPGQVVTPFSGAWGGTYGFLLFTNIRAPKVTQYIPATSIGNDNVGNPVVRGYPVINWSYSTLRPDYWFFIRWLYKLAALTPAAQQFQILLQYPDLSGNNTPVQQLAHFDPPIHAYRTVGAYFGVQLKFTYVGQAMLNPGVQIVTVV